MHWLIEYMNEVEGNGAWGSGERWRRKALQKLVHVIFCRASSTLDISLPSCPEEKAIVSVMTDYIYNKPQITSNLVRNRKALSFVHTTQPLQVSRVTCWPSFGRTSGVLTM